MKQDTSRLLIQGTQPPWSVDQIIDTHLIAQRPSKLPDFEAESAAMLELVTALADDPDSIAQRLAAIALKLTGAGSAGISLVDTDGGQEVFRWIATAGEYARYLRGTMPRDFSPCGEVLRRARPLLMRDVKRSYSYVDALHTPPAEALLVPFKQNGETMGTVWVIAHSADHTFDAEDLRIIQRLAVFASAVSSTVGLVRDLKASNDEQTRALQMSERERKRLDQLFGLAPGFVALLDGPKHTFALLNDAYQRLIGPRSVLGHPIADVLPEAVQQGFLELLDNVFATGEAHVGSNQPFSVTVEGETRQMYLDFVYQPITDDRGRVSGILVQGHDMTERHLASQALQKADKEKDEFLATLAHELRGPLSSIRISGQVLKRTQGWSERSSNAVNVIGRQTGVLAAMIDDLLDITSVRTGKIHLRLDPTNLQDVVASAIEGAQELLDKGGHSLVVNLPDLPVVIQGDFQRLTQVFTNLLVNAGKYTPPGGDISISVQQEVGAVCVAVEDTGIGIAPHQLSRVFDLFMQVSELGHTHTRGLGIGLSLVKRLVELHGGRVGVRSEVGRGSVFSVYLPS